MTPAIYLQNGIALGIDWMREQYKIVREREGEAAAKRLHDAAMAMHAASKAKAEPCEGCYCERGVK